MIETLTPAIPRAFEMINRATVADAQCATGGEIGDARYAAGKSIDLDRSSDR